MKEKLYMKEAGINGLTNLINKHANNGYELLNIFPSNAESWNQTHIQMRRASEDFFDIYFGETDNLKSYMIIPEADAIELLKDAETKLEYVYQKPNDHTPPNEMMRFPYDNQIWVVLCEGTAFMKV